MERACEKRTGNQCDGECQGVEKRGCSRRASHMLRQPTLRGAVCATRFCLAMATSTDASGGRHAQHVTCSHDDMRVRHHGILLRST
eukprot:2636548-Rhodomonas_salina.3